MISNEIISARQGNQDAIEHIIEQNRPLLKSVCRQYFLVNADADDIMQEALMGLIQAINTYDSDKNDSFPAFAYMVINRRLLSLLREQNRQKLTIQNVAISIDNEGAIPSKIDNDIKRLIVVIDAKNFEEEFLSKENMFATNETIRRLITPQDYEILTQYLAGFRYDEIAESTSTTPKYIDNRIQSVKRKLLKNKKLIRGE